MLGTKYPYSTLRSSSTHRSVNSGITSNHSFGPRHWIGFHHDFKKKSRIKLATVSSDLRCWFTGSYFLTCLVDITITLTFLHSMTDHSAIQLAASQSADTHDTSTLLGSQKIDTQAPLALYSSLFLILYPIFFSIWHQFVDNRLLVLDLLSVHLVRNINGSTIISYHPTLNIPATTAPFLHERIRFAGASQLFLNIFFHLPYSTARPKRVLAKHVPEVARPYSRSFNIHMAYHVCMGWGSGKFIWTYLLAGESCGVKWNTFLTCRTGKPRDHNCGNANYPRTSCHQSSSSSLHLSPRSLYKTY